MGLIDMLRPGRSETKKTRAALDAANDVHPDPGAIDKLVAMLVDDGVLRHENGAWVTDVDLDDVKVPPTVSALVAARLDHLEPSERDLVGRASVVGKVFQRSAVTTVTGQTNPPRLGPSGPRRMGVSPVKSSAPTE